MKNINRITGNYTNNSKFEANFQGLYGQTAKLGYGVADREEEGKFYWVTCYGKKAVETKALLDANPGALLEIDGEVVQPKNETFVNRTTGQIMKSNTFVNNATCRILLKTKAAYQAEAEQAAQAVAEPAPRATTRRRRTAA